MSTTINYSDPNKTPIVISDNTINHATSIYLVGSKVVGYGQYINDSILWLLENFANKTAPINPTEGQLWYDTTYPTNKILKIYNGASWVPSSGVYQQTADPSLNPSNNLKNGDIWVNTATLQLKVWNGTEWILVGPSNPTNGKNGSYSEIWFDNIGTPPGQHSVIVNYIDDQPISVVSKDSFVPNPVRAGFTKLVPGLNVSTETFDGVTAKISGLSDTALGLKLTGVADPVSADYFLRTDINGGTIDGYININSDAGIRIGSVNRTVFIERDSQNVALFSNRLNGGSIGLSVIKDNVLNQILTVDGNHQRVGINKKSPVAALDVNGTGRFSGDVNITSTSSTALQVSGGLTVDKSVTIGTVSGSTFVSNGVSTFNKNISVGEVSVAGAAIEPNSASIHDLGSISKPFRTVYASNFANTSTVYTMVSTGMIVIYSGSTLPDGWLYCDGSTFDTNTYNKLYAVLGTDTLPTLADPAPNVGYIIKY